MVCFIIITMLLIENKQLYQSATHLHSKIMFGVQSSSDVAFVKAVIMTIISTVCQCMNDLSNRRFF